MDSVPNPPVESSEARQERNKLARVQALQEQTRKAHERRLPDLERIAAIGPNNSEYDVLLVRSIFNMVISEICIRKYEINKIEAETAEGGGA